MRVDLTTGGLQQPENNPTGRTGQTGASASQAQPATGQSTSVDRTRFSFGQARVQSLTAQALAAPEIRQAKVASLGEAVARGAYAVDAGKVADAMAAEFAGGSFR